jgi:signal transduction histidine kinase
MLVLAGMDMVTVLVASIGILLIRRGQFRIAVAGFLAALLLGLFVSHVAIGYNALAVDQTSQMLALTVSGLVMGRRVLWTVFGVLLLVFIAGSLADAAGLAPEHAMYLLPSAILSYLVIVMVLDRVVTALQAEIDERERMQARLLHAQKLETMGRLASGVAHDFNNVLGVVIGYADARHRIHDIGDDPREIARDMADSLAGIEKSAQKGVELTRRLLCFGRNDSVRPVLHDAAQLLADVQPMLRRLLPRSIALTLELGQGALPVLLDRGQFELAVLDIASNARDAMPDGGELRVAARSADDAVEVTFSDTGHGMTQDEIARAFEPFYSTKPAGKGTGLGLAATKCVVERAGGTVSLDSAPARGTTVRIRLPQVVTT